MHERVEVSGWLNLNSDARDVDVLLHHLEIVLDRTYVDEMCAFHLRCAIVEVVNNSIQHAYQNEPGNPIDIFYRLSPKRVSVSVSDRGPAFHGDEALPQSNVADESGRGLEIARAMVSKLKFERRNGWNICRLDKHLT